MKKIKHFIKSGLIDLSCGVVSLGVTSGVGIIGTYAGELQSDNDNVSTEEKNISKIELNELQTSSDLSLLVMDSGWYQIVSAADSNLALEVKDGANVNGANVYVNKRSDSNSQKFFINNLKPGRNEYAIKTAVSNTEKALDVSGGSPARGVNVGQWHYHGGNAVRWRMYMDKDGNYIFESSTGNKVLDITGAKTTPGTNVWTWDYYGAKTQKWKLIKTDYTFDDSYKPATVEDGWYQITSAADSNLAVDVKDGSYVDGANVFGNRKSNSDSQKFYFESLGDNEYAIKTAASNKTKALDVSGASPLAGVNVGQWRYYGGNAVRWKLYKDNNGKYLLKSAILPYTKGDIVLDLTGAKTTPGTNIWTWNYINVDTQKWILNKVSDSNIPAIEHLKPATVENGWYRITSSANNNMSLEVKDGADRNGANIFINNKKDENMQKFYFESLGGNEYAIKTAVSNKDKALDVSGGSSARGVNVGQWYYHGGNAVRWKLYKSDDDKYVMVSSTGDRVLDITGARTTAGTNVWTWDYYGANTQKWNLTKDRRWVDGKGHWENTTKQVWKPNILKIVDEPEHIVYGCQLYVKVSEKVSEKELETVWTTKGGEIYWLENGFTMEDFDKIIIKKMKEEGYIGNYLNVSKKVPDKYHTEDHGYYETVVTGRKWVNNTEPHWEY